MFGPITSAKVALDEAGASLGYGYVQYEAPDCAGAAVERANGMLLKGRQLHVAPYKSKNARGVGRGFTNLYVKHLPQEIKHEADLQTMFETYGDITSVHMAKVPKSKICFRHLSFVLHLESPLKHCDVAG